MDEPWAYVPSAFGAAFRLSLGVLLTLRAETRSLFIEMTTLVCEAPRLIRPPE
jgi:hypothetical protein